MLRQSLGLFKLFPWARIPPYWEWQFSQNKGRDGGDMALLSNSGNLPKYLCVSHLKYKNNEFANFYFTFGSYFLRGWNTKSCSLILWSISNWPFCFHICFFSFFLIRNPKKRVESKKVFAKRKKERKRERKGESIKQCCL